MSPDDRIVTAVRADEDAQYEAGLRPRVIDEIIAPALKALAKSAGKGESAAARRERA